MDKHIYLIGFMGTGKSTISRALKSITHVSEIDMDALIETNNDMPITKMFEKYGEEYFRDKETECLKEISALSPAIISCGGGAVLRQENVTIMKETGIIVLLKATPETVFKRVRHSTNRPILNGNMNIEFISQLMEKRREIYEKSCTIDIDTDNKKPRDIANEILASM